MRPLHSLTSLRYFAALYVVLFHMPRGAHTPWALGLVIDNGFIAVQFFFVLSGFILAYGYVGRSGRVSPKDFWVARFARIYPVYLVALLLAIPEAIDRMAAWHFGLRGLAARLALVVPMLQSWYPPRALHIDGPG